MKNPLLHKYALFVACCTLLLVLAGASVTSTESSLSVPDWPLSYGQILPEMKGGVLFETGHRLVAKTVGFLVIILAIWIQRVDKPHPVPSIPVFAPKLVRQPAESRSPE